MGREKLFAEQYGRRTVGSRRMGREKLVAEQYGRRSTAAMHPWRIAEMRRPAKHFGEVGPRPPCRGPSRLSGDVASSRTDGDVAWFRTSPFINIIIIHLIYTDGSDRPHRIPRLP
eukprot:1206276-Prymnesium_polylepis.1